MATTVGIVTVLALGGALVWTLVEAVLVESRHHREMARIRDESRQLLARIYGR